MSNENNWVFTECRAPIVHGSDDCSVFSRFLSGIQPFWSVLQITYSSKWIIIINECGKIIQIHGYFILTVAWPNFLMIKYQTVVQLWHLWRKVASETFFSLSFVCILPEMIRFYFECKHIFLVWIGIKTLNERRHSSPKSIVYIAY